MSEELALPQLSTIQLISNARRALAEAKTLPDFRRVMEAATVAADAAGRAAKLLEAEGMAIEVVKQANEAANDAAAVRIEAQAGAGQILKEMADRGERATRGYPYNPKVIDASTTPGLVEILGEPVKEGEDRVKARARAANKAHYWQSVAEVPPETRVAYVNKIKEEQGEITTKGLLRFAAEPKESQSQDGMAASLSDAYNEVVKAFETIARFRNAGAIAAFAVDSRRKGRLASGMKRCKAWIEEAEQII